MPPKSSDLALPGASIVNELRSLGLPLKVNVSVESDDSLGLVSGLSETRCLSPRVGANSSRRVEVLASQVGSPESGRLLMGVVTFWLPKAQLLIRLLLPASPGGVLHNEELILIVQGQVLSI